jgi:hypothetical protein
MIIAREGFDGVVRERDIDVSVEELNLWLNGMLIQDAMPHLSWMDREFIISGTTPEMWDAMLKKYE